MILFIPNPKDFQHFIPATFLAGFSANIKTKRRNSQLSVYDLDKKQIFLTNAEKVFKQKGFYPPMVDKLWSFEDDLPFAIDELINNSLSAKNWIRCLVPFVASLLVRSPEYKVRFRSRLIDDVEFPSYPQELLEFGPTLELQRLLAPVFTAEWSVATVPEGCDLITSDSGYFPFVNTDFDKGMVIPISCKKLLLLRARRSRRILRTVNNSWLPIVNYFPISQDIFDDTLVNIIGYASQFILGPNPSAIDIAMNLHNSESRTPMQRIEPIHFIIYPEVGITENEFAWYKLVSNLSVDPSELPGGRLNWNFKHLKNGWFPGLSKCFDIPECLSPLQRIEDYIECNLNQASLFDNQSSVRRIYTYFPAEEVTKELIESVHDPTIHELDGRDPLIYRDY
jgi:hypothetical protein